jgi:predicted DNA-binding transcriptional regulator AlpA
LPARHLANGAHLFGYLIARLKGLQRVLLLPEVEKASGLKRTQIAEKEKNCRKAWIESEVNEWQQQIGKRDAALAARCQQCPAQERQQRKWQAQTTRTLRWIL